MGCDICRNDIDTFCLKGLDYCRQHGCQKDVFAVEIRKEKVELNESGFRLKPKQNSGLRIGSYIRRPKKRKFK